VIALSLVLVLGSAAALVVGLAVTNQLLIWVSIGASLFAALALAVAVMRRREPVAVHSEAAGGAGSIVNAGESVGLPAVESTAIGRHHTGTDPAEPEQKYPDPPDEPPVEDVSAPDALRVVDLLDEVMVVDGRPRYHLSDCRHLLGRDIIPLPIREAREAGFTPCGWCAPDTRLAERARRSAGP
jgi:hypothetical protein